MSGIIHELKHETDKVFVIRDVFFYIEGEIPLGKIENCKQKALRSVDFSDFSKKKSRIMKYLCE
jgi:hypothetical protein